VGEDGTERVVNRASEIGVGSASLRLARPIEVPFPIDKLPAPPEPPRPGDTQYPKLPDVQLKLSLNTNLEGDARREAVFQLLTDLAAAVDDGEISHCQIAASVVVPEKKAEALKRRAQAAGGTASSTEL
jgi:hypothetical protein